MLVSRKIVADNALLPNDMVTAEHVCIVLENLEKMLVDNIPGDVVEFGCYEGTTSLFIARLLAHYGSTKQFHVYDSFQGLPKRSIEDGVSEFYDEGFCKTTRASFKRNFAEAHLQLPVIHEGWFLNSDLPDYLSFAFLDGDFYSSIIDSLTKVYPRMVPNGRIIIHDYLYIHLPGVAKACADFLKGKPESVQDSGCGGLGLIVRCDHAS